MIEAYAYFYVEGWNEKPLKNEIDTEVLAQKVLDGKGTVHELCVEAAKNAAKPLEMGRRKKDWLDDYDEAIKTAGGDKDAAYQHYLDGRIDALAAELTNEVMDDIEDAVGEDDGEGDEDEDDDPDDNDGKDDDK
jgi:hypothetical protein